MYKKIQEKLKKLLKKETKKEHYETLLLKIQLKKKHLIKKKDKETKERLEIINKLIDKIKLKIKKLK